MSTEKKIEEYKILIEIYYKEVEVYYAKANTFMTMQLVIFGGVIAGFEKMILIPNIFRLSLCFLIIFTIIQLLVYKRGYDVLQALIKTLAKFEEKNKFNLLTDFTSILYEKKYIRIKKMNFPSFSVIIINICFLMLWVLLLINFENNISLYQSLFHEIKK